MYWTIFPLVSSSNVKLVLCCVTAGGKEGWRCKICPQKRAVLPPLRCEVHLLQALETPSYLTARLVQCLNPPTEVKSCCSFHKEKVSQSSLTLLLLLFLFFSRKNNNLDKNFNNFMKGSDAGKSCNTNYHLGTGSTREFLWSVLWAALEILAPGKYTYAPRICSPPPALCQ